MKTSWSLIKETDLKLNANLIPTKLYRQADAKDDPEAK